MNSGGAYEPKEGYIDIDRLYKTFPCGLTLHTWKTFFARSMAIILYLFIVWTLVGFWST
ncbi:hypothetical protein VCRA2134O163_190073 [Vibrio crassostreae]|nr:hypothetical protein VCRA2134O163_190073 [Vibrio crassostreae]